MTKVNLNSTYLDQFTYLVEEFQIKVEELSKQNKLLLTNKHYREIQNRINKISECFDSEKKIDYNSYVRSRVEYFENDNNIYPYNKLIYDVIAKSMEDIEADLEEVLQNIDQNEVGKGQKRETPYKYLESWQNLLERQNRNESSTLTTTQKTPTNGERSLVRRRIREFNKRALRKSSTVYSLSNLEEETTFNNILTKSKSTDVLCETNEKTENYLNERTNNTSLEVKPKILGGVVSLN